MTAVTTEPLDSASTTAEQRRLDAANRDEAAWREWGPYVSERAWGTVREDYSENGDAWNYFPFDDAKSRVFRWSEDGLAAISDKNQYLCLGLSLWNERDPILKERIFGLNGPQGNHGEDAKDYWWYLDSTPTHSWMTWRYHYPQAEFPYADLIAENARRDRSEAEYELVDTGIFADDRYWAITVDYAKADTDDLLMRITIDNRGPEVATLHVLPTLWFRNTWSWEDPTVTSRPSMTWRDGEGGQPGRIIASHEHLGEMTLVGQQNSTPLFCDNETNAERVFGVEPGAEGVEPAYPKDGINDYVIGGHRDGGQAGDAFVCPDRIGTKAALHHVVTLAPGEKTEIRVRLAAVEQSGDEPVVVDLADEFASIIEVRQREANEFFECLSTETMTDDEKLVVRQAIAGLMWGKQFFHYDVERWLNGDPTGPMPSERRKAGRNHTWIHLNNHDVISMPDPWEYPWYAAWDLAFHCIPLAQVDPEFAKSQLILLLREWYMHPNGAIPAYEWNFSDVNPPVHALAALRVFNIDGAQDYSFLIRVFSKLLINFTWWVNRQDSEGNNVFEGGFLGLDNIGPIDRSGGLPEGTVLEQSDGTAWMAMYCLGMLQIALILADHDPIYQDVATKFFEHFAYIADAIDKQGLWNEEDGFYYDVLRFNDGRTEPMRVRSMVGLLPLCAAATLGKTTLDRLPEFAERFHWFLKNKPQYERVIGATHVREGNEGRLFSIVHPERLVNILATMLDEDEFLSPYGLRSLSKHHDANPYTVNLGGADFTVGYEPAESTTNLFGGNSNWRGPLWFPVNYMVIEGLRRYARYLGDDLLVEYPTGSGEMLTITAIADDLCWRLTRIFLRNDQGRRPVFGDVALFQDDPQWRDSVPFYEYFHGDTARGLGAGHQTGWTALVADLIVQMRQPDVGGRWRYR